MWARLTSRPELEQVDVAVKRLLVGLEQEGVDSQQQTREREDAQVG